MAARAGAARTLGIFGATKLCFIKVCCALILHGYVTAQIRYFRTHIVQTHMLKLCASFYEFMKIDRPRHHGFSIGGDDVQVTSMQYQAIEIMTKL